MYLLYTTLLGLAFVAALPYFALQARRTGKYLPSLRERLGALPDGLDTGGRPTIWIHAVSVGEVLAARVLVPALRRVRPDHAIVVSATTLTGHELARAASASLDGVFFTPFDFPWAVDRALRRLSPALVVIMETEIWPNLIHRARRHGARIAIANGRLSARSTSRYVRVRGLLRRVLAEVDLFLMQSETIAERARAIGAPPERVRVTGSLKYDAPAAEPSDELRRLIGTGGPIVLAGSTLDGEEAAVLDAFRRVRAERPGVRLVLAPRHPERFAAVTGLVAAAGFRGERRSELAQPWSADVLVLDTLGELAGLYALADVAFVGGSLVPWGGHNVIEPAAAGVPVVVGPHMANFQDIADTFTAAGALVVVRSAEELAQQIGALLADPARGQELGRRGRDIVAANRGAVERTAEALAGLLR